MVTQNEFRSAMGSFAASVTVVTTLGENGEPVGITVTAFSSVSADPPLCLVCIHHGAASQAAIAATKKFAVNILAMSQEQHSNRFASRDDDKFRGIDWAPAPATGSPWLAGAIARVDCEVEDSYPAGDHTIYIGRILAVETEPGVPLLYWRKNYGGFSPA